MKNQSQSQERSFFDSSAVYNISFNEVTEILEVWMNIKMGKIFQRSFMHLIFTAFSWDRVYAGLSIWVHKIRN